MSSVLITGANGGIGRALVARFERAGWEVHATDRATLDVTSEASVSAAKARLGVPDVVINNAGVGLLGPVAELPDEALCQQLDINVRGLARVTRAFAPEMCRRGHGRIVNVSSLVGVFTLPWFGAYAATKHAVEALSDAMRLELRPHGVEVVVVEPSVVGTGFVDAAIASLARAAEGSLWRPQLLATIARREWAHVVLLTPERVAEAIFRAASVSRPAARYRVGLLASWLIRLAGLAPRRLSDFLLRALFSREPLS